MTWSLAGLGNSNDMFHFTESRAGVAIKGEPSVVLRTWWFKERDKRDSVLTTRHDIPSDDQVGSDCGMHDRRRLELGRDA